VRGENPAAAQRACDALQQVVTQAGWNDAFTAYARCARITRNLTTSPTLNPAAYTEAVEHDLHTAYEQAQQRLRDQSEPATVIGDVLHQLQGPINAYFEKVLVNAADEAVRNARLALVQQVAQLPATIADLSKLQGF
jgi:glycyl-tRNA synthetase beta subunit